MKKEDNDLFILNGRQEETGKALISAKNSGFLYGDGCFETMRAYKGIIFLFDEHMSRLCSSLCFFNYKNIIPASFKENIGKDIQTLFNAKGLGGQDVSVKVIVSRSEYKKKLDFKSGEDSVVIIFADAFHGYPAEYYEKGIDVIISSLKREERANDIYRHKTLNYLESVFAKNEARSRGAEEALFVSAKGAVLEGSVSNIFMARKDVLFTTSTDFNILPGITRKKILQLCTENNIAFRECRLGIDDFLNSDEIFLTNSLAEILPVKMIEGHNIKGTVPGNLTKKLLELYRKETSAIAPS